MIYNMRRRKKKKQLTWYFNEILKIPANKTYESNFRSKGESYYAIVTTYRPPSQQWMYYRYKSNRPGQYYETQVYHRYKNEISWYYEAYRTVTFDEEPTGELLAFLQANATPL